MNLPLIEILYRALNSPLGVVVETNEPEKLRQKLYAERKTDPDLGVLSFIISPTSPQSELWIIRNADND